MDEEDEWRLAEDIKGSKDWYLSFTAKTQRHPTHIYLDFANPLLPIMNFTDTPDMVPSGWATGHHTSGVHPLRGGC